MPTSLPISVVRTLVPLIVGWLLSLGLTAQLGVTADQITQPVQVLVTAGYYVVARVVEIWVSPRLGSILVGLGIGPAPAYDPAE